MTCSNMGCRCTKESVLTIEGHTAIVGKQAKFIVSTIFIA